MLLLQEVAERPLGYADTGLPHIPVLLQSTFRVTVVEDGSASQAHSDREMLACEELVSLLEFQARSRTVLVEGP